MANMYLFVSDRFARIASAHRELGQREIHIDNGHVVGDGADDLPSVVATR